MGAVSVYNVLLNAEYAARWLSAPEIYFAAPVPILTAVVAITLLRAVAKDRLRHRAPADVARTDEQHAPDLGHWLTRDGRESLT